MPEVEQTVETLADDRNRDVGEERRRELRGRCRGRAEITRPRAPEGGEVDARSPVRRREGERRDRDAVGASERIGSGKMKAREPPGFGEATERELERQGDVEPIAGGRCDGEQVGRGRGDEPPGGDRHRAGRERERGADVEIDGDVGSACGAGESEGAERGLEIVGGGGGRGKDTDRLQPELDRLDPGDTGAAHDPESDPPLEAGGDRHRDRAEPQSPVKRRRCGARGAGMLAEGELVVGQGALLTDGQFEPQRVSGGRAIDTRGEVADREAPGACRGGEGVADRRHRHRAAEPGGDRIGEPGGNPIADRCQTAEGIGDPGCRRAERAADFHRGELMGEGLDRLAKGEDLAGVEAHRVERAGSGEDEPRFERLEVEGTSRESAPGHAGKLPASAPSAPSPREESSEPPFE